MRDATDLDDHHLTITGMAARYNVTLRTLRFYEQAGLLAPLRAGNQRFYSAHDEIKLQLILTGKKLGFSLREIADLMRTRLLQVPLTPNSIVENLSVNEVILQIQILEKQRNDICAAIKELSASIGARKW